MNTYYKYAPNVYLAKCSQPHERGDIITLTTSRGEEHECVVYNLIIQRDDFYYYSIVRADGFNTQERARRKADRYIAWSESASEKSSAYHAAANEGANFLSLGEPIKIGHHSEKRHRALIERNHARMDKCIEMQKIAETHRQKAEYWAARENDINPSMPESIDFYTHKLAVAKEHHAELKRDKSKRKHEYSLTYAKKAVNEAEKNYQLAVKLWG